MHLPKLRTIREIQYSAWRKDIPLDFSQALIPGFRTNETPQSNHRQRTHTSSLRSLVSLYRANYYAAARLRSFAKTLLGCGMNNLRRGILLISWLYLSDVQIHRALLGTITRLSYTRRGLLLENLALRQQLAVFKRRHSRTRVNVLDKFFWVTARQLWSGCTNSLIVVTPETAVGWHRAGFRLYWKLISRVRRPDGRKRLPKEVRNLIFRMVAENPTWGAPRIRGELVMLGFNISERTISRWRTIARYLCLSAGDDLIRSLVDRKTSRERLGRNLTKAFALAPRRDSLVRCEFGKRQRSISTRLPEHNVMLKSDLRTQRLEEILFHPHFGFRRTTGSV
jgi:hypothetical protein